jgi:hypothetical protein
VEVEIKMKRNRVFQSTLMAGLTLSAASAFAAPETIGLSGTLPDLKTVEIENSHVYDYTFVSAPTDWRVQSGVWEMTNRWSCSPGWSWFGGRSEEIASVWNKRKFSGDISVQFYFAFKMGLSGTPSWHYHPSDVAITINGDGQNLGSGYSFIVGADNNSRTVLMKGGKTVAESRVAAALLPTLTDGNPDMNELHRRWWYVKINKIGPRIEGWLDNRLLFTYFDDKPLDAGQIALWTYNNGIMLSRVQVFYENEVRPGYTKALKVNNLNLPLKSAPAKAKTQITKKPTTRVAQASIR